MKKKKSLTISNSKEICDLPFSAITHVLSSGMSVTIYTTTGEKYFVSKNLKAIYIQLDDTFYRPNNSTIVSHSKIKKYLKEDGGVIIMICDTRIAPSRSRKAGFLEWYRKK